MKRLAVLLAFSMLPLLAQTSSIQGVVTDAQGAVIPAAVVSLTNTDTSAVRRAAVDDSGSYSFLEMPPGMYKIEFQKPGFTTYSSQVTLQVSLPSTLNVKLQVGATTDIVNVTADVSAVNTENATVGNPFTEAQVQSLPLQTRNVVALLGVEPGVTSTGQVLGARANQNYVTLDGVDVNGFAPSSANNGFNSAIPIPLDSVQEFRTTIAGQGADLGRTSGGQVSVVTKSGSNNFHGSLYEFNRNTDFEANDWFSNRAGVARPALIRNQYGGAIGGPILKNKLFFFYNFEGRKDRSQTATTATVPSDTLKQGIVEVKLKSNQIISLGPNDLKQVDPLGLGFNPYVLSMIQKYPTGNNPLGASDKGLNFNQLLFNAPQPLNNHVQVGKIDYNVTNNQTLSLRGTLNGASQVSTVELFPGQAPQSQSQDNSRGLSAKYTYIITPHLINVANYGYTRGGNASTGNLNVVPSFGFTTQQSVARGSVNIQPVTNYTDDMTWTHGRHTVQFGVNFHQTESKSLNLGNEPSYSFSSSTLLQLGGDITGDVTSYIQKSVPSASLFSTSNVISAFGAVFGMLNSARATYNYGINGQAIAFGTPITKDFKSNGPEGYVQDSWKLKPNLTVIAGVRYSIYGVPYEANGVEVIPTTSLNNYFAQRQASAVLGVPDYADQDAYLTYKTAGPVNHGAGYYPTSYTNFAPRLSMVYSPKGMLEKYLGKDSVFRAGYSLVYDNYGNDMASNFASGGSPGLTNTATQLVNTNYSTALRYDGSAFPALTTASGGAFPYTPPLLQAGFTTFTGVSSDLKAPYQDLLNASYARTLTHRITIEVGYAGRLSHRAIIGQDFGQPLSQYTDPKSGQSWQQAGTVLANLYYQGLTPAQVKANPSLVPLQPFIQNQLPAEAGANFAGSASANLFYTVYQGYSGSWLDALNGMDRIHATGGGVANGGCIFITGCNTTFSTQFSGLTTYANSGKGAYNAALISLRRGFSHGWGFDVNYTWSHSIDDGIGNTPQNSFVPTEGLGPSSFDMRHQITANFVVDVPVGKNKALFGHMPMWADEIAGGWQLSSLYTFHTGTPVNCSSSNQYNVNYFSSALCVLYPGVTQPERKLGFDQLGIPNEYANTNVGADFVPGYPGTPGYNGMARGLSFWSDDMALNKNFRLPKESMFLTLRVEGYNVFNKQEFKSSGMSISALQPGTTTTGQPANFGSSTFGEITASQSTPRVLQAVLRLTF